MNRRDTPLYSALLALQAQQHATLPLTMGHQVHAMFLHLIARGDADLNARLHDEPGYRPFTLSPLLGGQVQEESVILFPGQTYYVRITLFDEGQLWHCLSTLLLDAGCLDVRLDKALFTWTRLLSTPTADTTGWAMRTSWQQLAESSLCRSISLRFASPTAFNMNGDYFALFPEPLLVWDSLIRVWNNYAPEALKVEKLTLQDFIRRNVVMTACDSLSTHTLHYPRYTQKGFTGFCHYEIHGDDTFARQLTMLAQFARYSGVGYKTTMGMGQARIEERAAASLLPSEKGLEDELSRLSV